MKTFKRVISGVLAIAIILSLMPAMFIASANETLPADTFLVDTRLGEVKNDKPIYNTGDKVTVLSNGVNYDGVMGVNAFATLKDAFAASKGEKLTLIMAAGLYIYDENTVAVYNVVKDLTILGTNSGKSANRETNHLLPAYGRFDKERYDDTTPTVETVIKNIDFGLKEDDGTGEKPVDIKVDGVFFKNSWFTLTGPSVNNSTLTIENSMFDSDSTGVKDDMNQIYVNQWSATNNNLTPTIRNNRFLYVNRAKNGAADNISMYWPKNVVITGNYFVSGGNAVNIWGTVESDVEGKKSLVIEDNYLNGTYGICVKNGIYGDIDIINNKLMGAGTSVNTSNGTASITITSDNYTDFRCWDKNANVTIENNDIFSGLAFEFGHYVANTGACKEIPVDKLKVKNNTFAPDCESFLCARIKYGTGDGVDITDNYWGDKPLLGVLSYSECDASYKCKLAPYYLDKEMTISSDILDIVKVNSPENAKIEGLPSISVTSTVEFSQDKFTPDIKVASGASIEYYYEEECENKVANNAVDIPLKEGANYFYGLIKNTGANNVEYNTIMTLCVTRKFEYSANAPGEITLVDDDWRAYPIGSIVYFSDDGKNYRATMGYSAYSTINEAAVSTSAGGRIKVAAGNYTALVTLTKPVTLEGPKSGVNPNNDDWSLNDNRTNASQEAVITNNVHCNADDITVDGFTFNASGELRKYRDDNGGYITTGFYVKNCIFDSIQAQYGALMFSALETHVDVVISRCRFSGEFGSEPTCVPINVGVMNNFVFEENAVVNFKSTITHPVFNMNGAITRNDEIIIRNNFFKENTGGLNKIVGATNGKGATGHWIIDGNIFDKDVCTTSIIDFKISQGNEQNIMLEFINNTVDMRTTESKPVVFKVSKSGTFSLPDDALSFKYNKFLNVPVIDNDASPTPANVDAAMNYYDSGCGSPATRFTTKEKGLVFNWVPFYLDEDMNNLFGTCEILSMPKAPGAVIDNFNNKIIYETTNADLTKLDLSCNITQGKTVGTNKYTTSYAVYSDNKLTNELTNKILPINGRLSTAYIKLTTNATLTGNYAISNEKVYTITIKKPESNQANLEKVYIDSADANAIIDSTNVTVNVPMTKIKGSISFEVSPNATYKVYEDEALTKLVDLSKVDFDSNKPLKVYVRIRSEREADQDIKVYAVTFNRPVNTLTTLTGDEIKAVDNLGYSINSSVSSTVATVKAYQNEKHNSVNITFDTKTNATYKVFTDSACQTPATMPLAYTQDKTTTYYLKVTSESGDNSTVYTLNITRTPSTRYDVVNTNATKYTYQSDINTAAMVIVNASEVYGKIKFNWEMAPYAKFEIFKESGRKTLLASSDNNQYIPLSTKSTSNMLYITFTSESGKVRKITMRFINKAVPTGDENPDENIPDPTPGPSDVVIKDLGLATGASTDWKTESGTTIEITTKNNSATIKPIVSDGATFKLYSDETLKYEIKDTSGAYKLNTANAYMKYFAVVSNGKDTTKYTIIANKSVDSVTFVDTANSWSKKYVNTAYKLGLVSGTKVGDKYYYYPNSTATRQEIAAFMTKLLGTDVSAYASVKLPFTDTSKISSWALNSVKAAYALGIMNGSDGKFNPQANITRQEIFVIISRVAKLDESSYKNVNLNQFADASSIGKWATSATKAVVGAKIIGGSVSNGKTYIKPTANITRGEIAKILCEIYAIVRK